MIGGACTLGAYVLALWAMTQAPVALVAALRETSILFGTALSALVLKERFGWTRHAAAAAVVSGAVILKLA
jgi:drug/metabolite transporter (DMT)-like permease